MKAYRTALLFVCILVLLLTACSRPIPSTPDPVLVATQVNQMLTSIPVQTQLPSPVITSVPETATLPPAPTATLKPSATNTAVAPSATATPLMTPTVAGTATAIATPVVTAPVAVGDPRTTLGTPTRVDNFDSGQGWGQFEDDHVKVEAENGHLKMTAKNADGWHGWSLSNPPLTNFYLEATEKTGMCSGKDSYGLMARSPDPNEGYFLELSCDGQFKFQRWDGSRFITLVNWTDNSAINSGSDQVNRVGLKAEGDKFTFFANGIKIGETTDAAYDAGRFGLFVAGSSSSDFTVEVDEVAYWALP